MAEHRPDTALPRPITAELARFAARSRYEDLPERIRIEAARGFMNWVGCALGGCREEAVGIAAATVAELGGGPQASIIGGPQRTDVASAAFVNCISSSIMAYDDAHLSTVTHPTGPVGSALFAFAERQPVSGEAFLNAFALGVEITCRLSTLLLLPPANFNVGFYVTGLTAPIGVALAIGNLMGLDEARMNWAISLASSQAGGYRATHGTMTAHFRPGHAARSGVWGALLAAKGFDGAEDALEADKGWAEVYTSGADLGRAVDGLGERFELLLNAYKPYPCGIVIHPTIDACLEVRRRLPPGARLGKVVLRVHPLALKLTGVRTPRTTLESHVSLYHWAAAALVRGAASLPEMQEDCIHEPAIVAMRDRIEAIADPSVDRGASILEVELDGGGTLRAEVTQATGSVEKPMTDDDLDAKFRGQAGLILPPDRVETLLDLCRGVGRLADPGSTLAEALRP